MSLDRNVAYMDYADAIEYGNGIIDTYEENHQAMNVYSPVHLGDVQKLQRNLQQHSFFPEGRMLYDRCQAVLERDGGAAFKPKGDSKRILSAYEVEQRRLRGEFDPL